MSDMLNWMFSGLTNLGEWKVKESKNLDDTAKSCISKAEVAEGTFGKQVVFTLINGSRYSIPVARDCDPAIGSVVELDKITVLKLSKAGSDDITRVDIQK